MISIIPIAKEKALMLNTKNQYMFYAPLDASKDLIAKNVAEQFKVTVTDVKTLVRKGKPARYSRGKKRYPGTTYKQDVKIAYVTLKEGDKIKIFDEEPVETETKDAKAEEKKLAAANASANAEVKKASLFTKRRTGNRGDK